VRQVREGSDIGGEVRTDGRAVGRKATKSLTPKPTRSRAAVSQWKHECVRKSCGSESRHTWDANLSASRSRRLR